MRQEEDQISSPPTLHGCSGIAWAPRVCTGTAARRLLLLFVAQWSRPESIGGKTLGPALAA